MHVYMYTQSLSRVWLFGTPWTVAHQAPRPWDFPGKNTGVGCFSRGSSPPRDQTHISCIGRWILYHGATYEGDTLSYCSKSDKNKLCCSNWFFWGIFQMSTTDTESYDFCYFSCFKLTSIFYYHFIPWGVICGLYLQSKKYFFAKKLIEKINWWQINFWREDIMKYISLNLNIRQ